MDTMKRSTDWPSEYVIRTSSNWVEKVPRPTAETCHHAVLESRQAEWDAAHERNEAAKKRAAEITAEREEREKAQREEARKAEESRQERRRADREEHLRRAHFANGGTPATWEDEKAGILAKDREQRTLSGEDADRRAYASFLRNSF